MKTFFTEFEKEFKKQEKYQAKAEKQAREAREAHGLNSVQYRDTAYQYAQRAGEVSAFHKFEMLIQQYETDEMRQALQGNY